MKSQNTSLNYGNWSNINTIFEGGLGVALARPPRDSRAELWVTGTFDHSTIRPGVIRPHSINLGEFGCLKNLRNIT